MATPTKTKELTLAERAALFLRWQSKVDATKGPNACWPWNGAKSMKRNGRRGVIRVGGRDGQIMSAKRVGLLLAKGGRFTDPKIAQLDAVHMGKGAEDCVNPRHHEWGTTTGQRRRASDKATSKSARGAGRAKGQR